jgi:hypothetical protein
LRKSIANSFDKAIPFRNAKTRKNIEGGYSLLKRFRLRNRVLSQEVTIFSKRFVLESAEDNSPRRHNRNPPNSRALRTTSTSIN